MSPPIPLVISLTVLQWAACWTWTWTLSVQQPKPPRSHRWMIHGMNIQIVETLHCKKCQASQEILCFIQKGFKFISWNFAISLKCWTFPVASAAVCSEICIETRSIILDTNWNHLISLAQFEVLLALLLSNLPNERWMMAWSSVETCFSWPLLPASALSQITHGMNCWLKSCSALSPQNCAAECSFS